MSRTLETVALPHRCSNLLCPNKPHEGTFVLVETEEPVVGGHHGLRLYMCAPCADALTDVRQGGTA